MRRRPFLSVSPAFLAALTAASGALIPVPPVATAAAAAAADPARTIAVYESGPGAPAPARQVEAALRAHGLEIWNRDGRFVIAGGDDSAIADLASEGIAPVHAAADLGQWIYLFNHDERSLPPAAGRAARFDLSVNVSLYLFPRAEQVDVPALRAEHARRPGGSFSRLSGAFQGVPRVALPPLAPHPSDANPSASVAAIDPLVSQIVASTSQAAWFQDVRDLSGDNTVTVGGNSVTIATRFSDAMFPVPQANALATEYLLERGAAWGYTGVRESYTSSDSGCFQANPWQNVVFTIPGQVDFGGHQQVIFVTHYDSISYDQTQNLTFSPGADDAISGGAALIEAMRTFQGYAFANTVKIVFFSGEEEGLCGSTAYTRQHPASDMWRAVNMDQTAFDGNKNGWMDVYNWDQLNSPASVALGDLFIQNTADYGAIINPANIVRDTSKFCQTDHCPFWNVGVAAICLIEDNHNGDLCPCFDQLQTPTCRDTVTQIWNGSLMFDQDYSWPTQKAAIATVAALADPLYACPSSAPAPVVTPGNNSLRLDWTAAPGVTNYVVERAASCAGPFAPIASVAGSFFEDGSVSNGSPFAYRIRTCPNQASACVGGTAAAGPSVVYQFGSAAVTADSGDHDNIPDNCELVTVSLNLVNDGNVPLTNVKLAAVAPGNARAPLASAVPQLAATSLAQGATATAGFKFYLGRNTGAAACGEALPFSVAASSDQTAASPPKLRSFSLAAERVSTGGPLSWGFETGLSGWTTAGGSFTRVAGGAPGSTAFSMHSGNVNNGCDAILSPLFIPSAGSTLSIWVNYILQSGSRDRAVVRAVDPATGMKTLLTPAGQLYTTNGNQLLLCDNVGNLRGWSGNSAGWKQATFALGAFAGVPIQIEIRYSTDSGGLGTQGFWFDAATVTNASQPGCDSQADLCTALPAEVSPVGAAVPFTIDPAGAGYALRFSEVAGATAYEIYGGTLGSLHGGTYDHAAAGSCGILDALPGDGQVTTSLPAAGLADGGYFLAVARSSAGESPYGTATSGAPIPLAYSACP